MNAVILFSHGSTLCGSGQALEAHAAVLRRQFPVVEVGYLNYCEPDFDVAVAKVAAAGASKVIVVPFFLVPGYFVSKALPDRIDKVRPKYPSLEFVIAEPIGADDCLADALLASAIEAKGPLYWRNGLVAATKSCQKRPDCPLYGTANCLASDSATGSDTRETLAA